MKTYKGIKVEFLAKKEELPVSNQQIRNYMNRYFNRKNRIQISEFTKIEIQNIRGEIFIFGKYKKENREYTELIHKRN